MFSATRLLGGLLSDRLERSFSDRGRDDRHAAFDGSRARRSAEGGSSVVGTVATVAGVAAVGGLAYVACRHFKGGSAGDAAPLPSAPAAWPGAPAAVPGGAAPQPAWSAAPATMPGSAAQPPAWPGPPTIVQGAAQQPSWAGSPAATSFSASLDEQIAAAGGKPIHAAPMATSSALPGSGPVPYVSPGATPAPAPGPVPYFSPGATAAPAPAPGSVPYVSPGATPTPAPGSGPVPYVSPGAPPAEPRHEAQEAEALLLVRAMIAAAAIDGQIDPTERQAVVAAAGRAGLQGGELAALERELASPHRPAALLGQVDSPELAKQFYLVTLLAIDVDVPSEHAYVAGLPGMLGLTAETVQEVHRLLGRASQP